SLAHRVPALLRSRRLRTNRFAFTLKIFSRLCVGSVRRCGRRSCSRLLFYWPNVAAGFVIPGFLVVGFTVEAGEQPVFGKLEPVFYDESGIGVVDEVIFRDPAVLDRVIDDSAEKSDISAGSNL